MTFQVIFTGLDGKTQTVKFEDNALSTCFDYIAWAGGNVSDLSDKPWCYHISKDLGTISAEEIAKERNAWLRKNTARKIFLPGHILTTAFILIAIGLGLGAACPPALAITSIILGMLFPVVAVIYAIELRQRKRAMQTGSEYKDDMQTRLNVIFIILLLAALTLTLGHFIAVATGGAGIIGGVVSLTTGFFSTAGLPSTLCSILAGATLILAPVNFFYTICICSIGSGIYKRFYGTEIREIKILRQRADTGDAASQYNLGFCYERGYGGLTQDLSKALGYYQKSADQGEPAALYAVGIWYQDGRGGNPIDLASAIKYYQQAADAGHTNPVMLANLGYLYETDTGGSKDLQKALDCYQKSADQGEPTALCNLGCYYEEGKGGVSIDLKKALDYYQKAVSKGLQPAQDYVERVQALLRNSSSTVTATPASPLAAPAVASSTTNSPSTTKTPVLQQ